MKFLLVALNAKYIHSNPALYSLRAHAGEALQPYVELAEYTINHMFSDVLGDIYKRKPDVIGFSCYIWNIETVLPLVKELKKLMPTVPIWLGGPEVSYDAPELLRKYPEITGIMVGEGEETFRELLAYYLEAHGEKCDETGVGAEGARRKKALSDIPGLCLQSGYTEARALTDLSKLPFLYEDLGMFENRIIYYESSRGCPFRCSYCLSSIDKKVRLRELDTVKKELQFFLDKKVPQVKFVDRTFNCDHKHAMAIWQFIKQQDNGITNFHFEVSADLINEAELDLITSMRPGLIQLEIGVQSTNDTTITEIHRTMNLKRLKEIVKKVQDAGNIHEHLDLIAGLPYEDYATFGKSFDEIYELKPNQLQLGFLKVLKGSYMFEHASEYGMIYHSTAPYEVMQTKWLSFEEILKIKQVEEMLEIYYNSGQFEVTMKLMDVLFESPFYMFQEFGAFYEEKGYFAMSHSRIRRCEILLEFIRESFERKHAGMITALRCDAGEAVKICRMLEESLTFDLYYRENCKSRPSWAPAISEFKQMTKQYCKKGVLSHVEPFHYRFPDKQEKVLAALPEYQEESLYVLFDYEHRDALDHQAEVVIMEHVSEES